MALLKLDPSNHKISDLFDYVSINKFVVPPFQRPYAWTIEHCEALWNDIEQSWNSNYVIPCFLGSIIVYPENENEKQLLLIDGQQRMTTIMLFLRAAYLVIQSTMKVMTNEETFDLRMECRAQIKKLETSLWKPLEPGYDNSEIDKSCPRLERHNIEGSIDWFKTIIDSGKLGKDDITPESRFAQYICDDYASKEGAKLVTEVYKKSIKNKGKKTALPPNLENIINSNECVNYAYFLDKLYNFNESLLPKFINKFLNMGYLLPLNTANSDSALLIFDVLNNRGLPLTTSDILKNTIATHFRERNEEFKPKWDALLYALKDNNALKDNEKKVLELDILFRHYMNALRMTHEHQPGDYAKSKEPEIRDYFTKTKFGVLGVNSLKNNKILDNLEGMAKFLVDATHFYSSDIDSVELISMDARYDLEVLKFFKKTEKWQYLITTFWYCYHALAINDPEEFRRKFARFIRYCTVVILCNDILGKLNDTVIPTLCEQLAIRAAKSGNIDSSPSTSEDALDKVIPQDKDYYELRKALLDMTSTDSSDIGYLALLYAYSFVDTNGNKQPIMTFAPTIEHILPQSWDGCWDFDKQDSEKTDEEVIGHVHSLGNLIIISKTLNSRASNKKFDTKLNKYRKANPAELTIELQQFISHYPNPKENKWKLSDIEERAKHICEYVESFIRNGLKEGII